MPLGTLRDLIQERGERLLSQLREGPIGRLIPGGIDGSVPPIPPVEGAAQPHDATESAEAASAGVAPPSPPSTEGEKPAGAKARLTEIVESSKQTLDQWQHTIDERIGAILPGLGLFRELKDEVKRLTQRVEELEAKVHGANGVPSNDPSAAEGALHGESIKKE